MSHFVTARSERGFSLIEVLIAVVVLSFGLLALAALQTRLIQASSEAKAQSVALALAKDRLEEMRSFTCISGCAGSYQSLTSSASAEVLNDASGSLGGTNYNRTWTVNRYAVATGATTFSLLASNTGAPPSGYQQNSEFKTIEVRVTWTDASGNPRQVVMEDAVAGLDPADTARARNSRSASRRGPKVIIVDPSTEAGVIPIAVGGGTETAATNPKPVVTSKLVETRFDVLTYAALSGGTALAQSRVETTVVGCTCQATAGTAKGFRPTFWNGFRYVAPQQTAGNAPARAATGVTQSRYCTACCRDHHDTGFAGPKFSPRRAAHTHYKREGGTLVPAGAGEDYLEACRLIRVDGIFDVAADPSNDFYNVLATATNGDSPLPSTSNPNAVLNYQNFVLNYLDSRFVTPSPGAGMESGVYNNRTTPSPAAAATTNDLDNPASITLFANTGQKWLHSRGLYIDFLEQQALDAIGDAESTCPGTGGSPPSAVQKRDCVLKVLPFTSINLTEIANWTSSDLNQIAVTNNAFDGSATNPNPVRGNVVRQSTASNGATPRANTTIGQSASGLKAIQDQWEINPEEIDTAHPLGPLADAQAYEIQGGTSGSGGRFVVQLGPYATSGSAVVDSTLHVQACSASAAALTHTCSSSVSMPASAQVRIQNYNQQFLDDRPNPCQTNKNADMPFRVSYDILSVTSSNAGAGIGTLQVVNPDQPGAIGQNGEYTVVPVNSLADGDTLTATFSSPVYRCPASYTCGGSGNKEVFYSTTFTTTTTVSACSPPRAP